MHFGEIPRFPKAFEQVHFSRANFHFLFIQNCFSVFLEKQSLKQKNVVFSFQFGFVFVIKRLNVKKMCYKENVSISVKKKRRKNSFKLS